MEHPLFSSLLQVCLADAAGSRGGSDKENKILQIAEMFNEEILRGN